MGTIEFSNITYNQNTTIHCDQCAISHTCVPGRDMQVHLVELQPSTENKNY